MLQNPSKVASKRYCFFDVVFVAFLVVGVVTIVIVGIDVVVIVVVDVAVIIEIASSTCDHRFNVCETLLAALH